MGIESFGHHGPNWGGGELWGDEIEYIQSGLCLNDIICPAFHPPLKSGQWGCMYVVFEGVGWASGMVLKTIVVVI